MKAVCVVCEANVTVPDDCCEGELVICPDCGTELEVVSLEPLTLEEAPQVQEDWGRRRFRKTGENNGRPAHSLHAPAH